MKVLCILLFITLAESLRNDWVDPHEMKINVQRKLKRSQSENDKSSDLPNETVANTAPSVEENMSLIYLKRTINLILQTANRDSDDPNEYTGTYKYTLDSEEYKFLVEFSSNEMTNNENLRKLDTVLSRIFSKSYQNNILNFVVGLKQQISNIYFLSFMGITVCLYVMYTLLKSNSGFKSIILYFMFLILIVDYGFRYRLMYEDAEEHNMKVTYTAACDTDKMSWTQYLKFVLKNQDCEKRMVTPLDVGLNQLKYVIIIPLESIGTGMGHFGKELWRVLPFPWNIVIFPIMLVFILIIIFIFVLAMKDTAFKLKLFHLLHFEFGKEKSDEDRISGKTLDKLLDATIHRRIEDTRSSPVKTEPKKIDYKNKPTNNKRKNKNKEKQQEQDAGGESTGNVDDNDRTKNISTDDCVDNKKEK